MSALPQISVPSDHGGVDEGTLLRRWIRLLASSRHERVTLIILACTLMGLTDLLCTLAYVGGIGMIEQNPLARAIIERGGAGWLIVFKLLTMSVMGGCIYLSRRHAKGELCAWGCCVLLTALMAHWTHYNAVITDPENNVLMATSYDVNYLEGWVRFED